MKKILKVLAWLVVVVVVLAAGTYAWAYTTAKRAYERTWTAHNADFPIPFPLSDAELTALRTERVAAGAPAADPLAGADLQKAALDQATRRGQHLIASRLGCNGCHGDDFGGKELVNVSFVGYWAAPNITTGQGGVTKGFTAHDWDLAVRHGIKHTGTTSSMPSEEFQKMSDHELSDVVAYIQSKPPVNRESKPVRLGPVFSFMLARNPNSFLAAQLDHQKPHAAEPPPPAVSVELGEHIVQVCRGCHGPTLSGGKIEGDPNMPIVGNITPHETGIKAWSEADFLRALHEGKRPDGTELLPQMPWRAYGQMSDTELRAIYAYLRTVPPVAKGNR